MLPLVLASQSPRRRELLAQAGFRFQVMPARGREKAYRLTPARLVERLAGDKAVEVARSLSGAGKKARVFAADTLVFLNGKRLGKPKSAKQARDMLGSLSGRKHEVLTGVALLDMGENGKIKVSHGRTRVWFRKLSEEEIDDYVRSGEPMDKAGAYGIQSGAARFVEKIDGCYFNVVGLPMKATLDLLE
jgi:septum formation protein